MQPALLRLAMLLYQKSLIIIHLTAMSAKPPPHPGNFPVGAVSAAFQEKKKHPHGPDISR